MARPTVRMLLVAAAAIGVLADASGVLVALRAGQTLTGWQLTCLGVGIPAAVLGLLVTWHQPTNRIAWILLAASAGFGVEQFGLGLLASPAAAVWEQAAAYALLLLTPGPLTTVWVLLVLLFPDGRFNRPIWRRYALLAVGVALLASLMEFLIAPSGYLPVGYGIVAPPWLAGPLALGPGIFPFARSLDVPGVLLPAVALLALV